MADVLAAVLQLVQEVRELKTAPVQAPSGNDALMAVLNTQAAALTAMINGQTSLLTAVMNHQMTLQTVQMKADAEVRTAQIKADADARIEQSRATTESNRLLLDVMTRTRGGDEKLATLLGALGPYLQPPPQQDIVGILRQTKELFSPPPPSAASEIRPIAEMFGGIWTQSLAADAKRAEALADARKPDMPAASQREGREPLPLVHVPGLGVVRVVVAEGTRPVAAEAPALTPPPASTSTAPAGVAVTPSMPSSLAPHSPAPCEPSSSASDRIAALLPASTLPSPSSGPQIASGGEETVASLLALLGSPKPPPAASPPAAAQDAGPPVAGAPAPSPAPIGPTVPAVAAMAVVATPSLGPPSESLDVAWQPPAMPPSGPGPSTPWSSVALHLRARPLASHPSSPSAFAVSTGERSREAGRADEGVELVTVGRAAGARGTPRSTRPWPGRRRVPCRRLDRARSWSRSGRILSQNRGPP